MAFLQDDVTASAPDAGSLAFSSNVSAGSVLIAIVVFANDLTQVVGISDTRGNTWARAFRQSHATGQAVEVWYAANPNAGACTLTWDWDAAATAQAIISEYGGFSGGVSLDQANGSDNPPTGTPTATPTHGSITTTQAVGVSVAGARCTSAFSVTAVGDGFTALTYSTRVLGHYKVLAATETHDCNLTMAAAETMVGAIANFYESGGTPPPPADWMPPSMSLMGFGR
jgi:hypothetical protein